MVTAHPIEPDAVRPLRRSEYDALVLAGAFEGEHLELLAGALIRTTPQGPQHSWSIQNLMRRLVRALDLDAVEVRIQAPLALSDASEPEPDVAVVPRGHYLADHPTEALWVIEVAHSSHRRDLELKAELYAIGAVREYWVLDLPRRCVHVHTGPTGDGWTRIERHTAGELTPEHLDVTFEVAELLPPAG